MSAATNQPSYAQDRAEIEDLMARYLFAMDWADYEAYAEMFTADRFGDRRDAVRRLAEREAAAAVERAAS